MIVAQTERFELPSPRDTGFQIRRNTRLCDVCSIPSEAPSTDEPYRSQRPHVPGLHHAGSPVAASG